jgi:Tfp pilus assembly protein PilO
MNISAVLSRWLGQHLDHGRVTRVDAMAGVVALLLTGTLMVAVVRPVIAHAEASDAERYQLASSISGLRDTEQALADLLARRRALEQDRATVVKLRPASALNARLADLPTIAQAHGVVVSEVTPGQIQAQGGRGRVPIRVAGVASFRSFAAMLADLHALHRDLEVTSLSIDAAGSGPDSAARFSLALLWHTARAESAGRASGTQRTDGADSEARADGDAPSAPAR